MLCSLCGQRRAKRACPALGQQIWPVCCATKRLVEIRCPDRLRLPRWPARTSRRRRQATARVRPADADGGLGPMSGRPAAALLPAAALFPAAVPGGRPTPRGRRSGRRRRRPRGDVRDRPAAASSSSTGADSRNGQRMATELRRCWPSRARAAAAASSAKRPRSCAPSSGAPAADAGVPADSRDYLDLVARVFARAPRSAGRTRRQRSSCLDHLWSDGPHWPCNYCHSWAGPTDLVSPARRRMRTACQIEPSRPLRRLID